MDMVWWACFVFATVCSRRKRLTGKALGVAHDGMLAWASGRRIDNTSASRQVDAVVNDTDTQPLLCHLPVAAASARRGAAAQWLGSCELVRIGVRSM